jgi:hypothetical protein
VAEELAIGEELGDEQEALLGLDDFVEGENIAVAELLEHLDLALDSEDVLGTHPALVDDLHGHLLASRQVQRQVHLPKCPFPNVLP